MSNTNCLAGIACPKCGYDESLEVAVTGFVTLTDDGYSEYPRDCDYNDDSYASCPQCFHEGTAADFYTSNQPGPSYDVYMAEPDKWEWTHAGRFTCEDDRDGIGARRAAHLHARNLRTHYHCAYVAVRPANQLPLPVRPPLMDEPPFKDFSASWLGL